MAWAYKSISVLSLLEKTGDDTDGKKEKTKRESQKAFQKEPITQTRVFHWFQLKLGLVVVWGINP